METDGVGGATTTCRLVQAGRSDTALPAGEVPLALQTPPIPTTVRRMGAHATLEGGGAGPHLARAAVHAVLAGAC
jgi:hypothetical protein